MSYFYAKSVAAGPNAWYDSTTTTTSTTYISNVQGKFTPVTVAQGGSCTKVRFYIKDKNGGTYAVKVGIYNSSRAKLTEVIGTIVAGTSQNAYFEVTLGSPLTVTAADYWLGFITDTTGNWGMGKAASGTETWNNDTTYPTLPDPFTTGGSTDAKHAMGMFVA